MKHLYTLVDLINNYDGSSSIEGQIRDLICYLSENEKFKNNELYKTVIFEASKKLRVFGYIKGHNPISVEEFSTSGAYDIKQQAIQNYYSSKVFPNNILDKKQKEIVDNFMCLETKRLLISAPTSFGKTFILREILFLNQDRYRNILLVFPTIALLNENTGNMKVLTNTLESEYKIVNNVYSNICNDDKHIFILTPERVLQLLSDNQDLTIDFFFFDEVYKIDEDFSMDEDSCDKKSMRSKQRIKDNNGSRAKAFRIALYLLSRDVKEFYLAGPYLSLKNAEDGLKRYIQENKISTMEIDFEPTMRIEIEAWKKSSSEIHPIFGKQEINIYDNGSLSTMKKVVGIIKYLNENDLGQSIFYCSTPAYSMQYVRKIIQSLPITIDNTEILCKDFIMHLKQKYGVSVDKIKNTAEYWSLISALENGYGIHHGKFPKYIQNELLKMFNEKKIKHLFCTSTIIEGVNTNAKNIVIVNNSVGNKTMSAFTLKNIKGRAGRYYRHYIGRVFYTDRKQRDIENKDELRLNFPTYSSVELLNVDLDNTLLEDLSDENQAKKSIRDNELNYDVLPDEIFIKNRLYARDIQERYLAFISKSENFSVFEVLVKNSSNIKKFLSEKLIDKILQTFENSGILEKNKANIYYSVVSKYSYEGTRGIIKYHVQKHIESERENDRDPLITIDKAYISSFDQIRNIVEYEVPKLLCLFEAIFSYAGVVRGYDMSEFNMSLIIRFFELGTTTEFGLSLVEYGFPIDTIHMLEKNFPSLGTMTTIESVKYLRQNSEKVLEILNAYELSLLKLAIMSFEN